jgi:hypothetical protein
VVGEKEEIEIVLGQFIEIPTDRVVDGIIHYKGPKLESHEPPLIEMIMKAMYDPPLTGNFG